MRKQTKIKEIADRAGVSVTTVLNVIHGRTDKVSVTTRKRIEKILDEENYQLNIRAGLLGGKETKLIVIIDGSSENACSAKGESYGRLKKMETQIFSKHYYALIHFTNCIEEAIRFSMGWKADGVVMLGFPLKNRGRVEEGCHVPVIWIDEKWNQSMTEQKMGEFLHIINRQ